MISDQVGNVDTMNTLGDMDSKEAWGAVGHGIHVLEESRSDIRPAVTKNGHYAFSGTSSIWRGHSSELLKEAIADHGVDLHVLKTVVVDHGIER